MLDHLDLSPWPCPLSCMRYSRSISLKKGLRQWWTKIRIVWLSLVLFVSTWFVTNSLWLLGNFSSLVSLDLLHDCMDCYPFGYVSIPRKSVTVFQVINSTDQFSPLIYSNTNSGSPWFFKKIGVALSCVIGNVITAIVIASLVFAGNIEPAVWQTRPRR